MRMRLLFILLMAAVWVFLGSLAVQESYAQTRKAPAVRNMDITGQIAKAAQGYIIRGTAPAEIFTILNPEPDILDTFVKSGKTVRIMVRIVSGDNVNIEKIDGKVYGKASDAGQTKKDIKKKDEPSPK